MLSCTERKVASARVPIDGKKYNRISIYMYKDEMLSLHPPFSWIAIRENVHAPQSQRHSPEIKKIPRVGMLDCIPTKKRVTFGVLL